MAMGRPTQTGETRSHYLRVRLSPTELQALVDAPRGSMSQSDYVRAALQNERKRRS